MTVIHGLPERGPALEARLSEMKRLCGAGGTLKDGVVEIQGDHRERLATRLRALGYTVKLAGGCTATRLPSGGGLPARPSMNSPIFRPSALK